VASQLEVAVLDRARDHRTFRRIRTARLDELLSESRALTAPDPDPKTPEDPKTGTEAPAGSSGPSAASNAPAASGPPTGPDPSSSDRGSGQGTPPNPA